VLSAALLAIGLAGPASADQILTYDFTDCHATGGCNAPGPYGQVKVDLSNDLHTITITVTPAPGRGFINAGSGFALAFDFNCGGCTLHVALPDNVAGHWSLCSGSCHTGGTGDWDYGIDCKHACGNGGNHPLTTPITITLTSTTNLALKDFLVNGKGYIFSTDLCYAVGTNGRCAGRTGDSAALPNQQQVPEPLSLSLFGSGLIGMTTLRRWRKRRRSEKT
jgi:hypothetical protein